MDGCDTSFHKVLIFLNLRQMKTACKLRVDTFLDVIRCLVARRSQIRFYRLLPRSASTPALLTTGGKLIPGYVPPMRLAAILDEEARPD